jgi:hypothetical protein
LLGLLFVFKGVSFVICVLVTSDELEVNDSRLGVFLGRVDGDLVGAFTSLYVEFEVYVRV